MSLREGGLGIFTLIHPCNSTRISDRYQVIDFSAALVSGCYHLIPSLLIVSFLSWKSQGFPNFIYWWGCTSLYRCLCNNGTGCFWTLNSCSMSMKHLWLRWPLYRLSGVPVVLFPESRFLNTSCRCYDLVSFWQLQHLSGSVKTTWKLQVEYSAAVQVDCGHILFWSRSASALY